MTSFKNAGPGVQRTPKPPLCKGRWADVSQLGGSGRLRFLRWRPAPPVGTLRWGSFLTGQKVTKDPPKAGPSPALWNPPRGTGWRVHLPFSALGPVGPHRCPGSSTEVGYFCGSLCAYSQGLTLVRRCSQRWAAWLPAAGTPLLQGRPGHRNHPTIGPVAQGGLVWWQYQKPQQG